MSAVGPSSSGAQGREQIFAAIDKVGQEVQNLSGSNSFLRFFGHDNRIIGSMKQAFGFIKARIEATRDNQLSYSDYVEMRRKLTAQFEGKLAQTCPENEREDVSQVYREVLGAFDKQITHTILKQRNNELIDTLKKKNEEAWKIVEGKSVQIKEKQEDVVNFEKAIESEMRAIGNLLDLPNFPNAKNAKDLKELSENCLVKILSKIPEKEAEEILTAIAQLWGTSETKSQGIREKLRLTRLSEQYSSPTTNLPVTDVKQLKISQTQDVPFIWMGLNGETGSGETAILNRIVDDIFAEHDIDIKGFSHSSLGVEYQTREGKRVQKKLNFWDHPGSKSQIISTYRDIPTREILLTYDLSNSAEGQQKKRGEFVDGLKKLPGFDENCKIILVGTKLDMVETEEDEERLKQFAKFAKENGLNYVATSSKMNVGIDTLLTHLAARDYEVQHPQKETWEDLHKPI